MAAGVGADVGGAERGIDPGRERKPVRAGRGRAANRPARPRGPCITKLGEWTDSLLAQVSKLRADFYNLFNPDPEVEQSGVFTCGAFSSFSNLFWEKTD